MKYGNNKKDVKDMIKKFYNEQKDRSKSTPSRVEKLYIISNFFNESVSESGVLKDFEDESEKSFGRFE